MSESTVNSDLASTATAGGSRAGHNNNGNSRSSQSSSTGTNAESTATNNARYVKIEKTDSTNARIGDGAYGVVYRALDKVLNEKVALKRIKLENEEGTIQSITYNQFLSTLF